MIFETKIPEPPLDQYVQNIVYYSGYSPVHAMERFFPDGTTNLVLADQDGTGRAILGVEPDGSARALFADANGDIRALVGVGADGEPSVSTFEVDAPDGNEP